MKVSKKELAGLELLAKELTRSHFEVRPSGMPGTFVAFCYSHPQKLQNPVKGAFEEDVLAQKIDEYIAEYNGREERLEAIQKLEEHFSAPKKTRTAKKVPKTTAVVEEGEKNDGLTVGSDDNDLMDSFLRKIGGLNDRGYRGVGGAYQVMAVGDADEEIPGISAVKEWRIYLGGEYKCITSRVRISCGRVYQPDPVWVDAEDARSWMNEAEIERRRAQHGANSRGFYQPQVAKKYFYIDFLDMVDIKNSKKIVFKK